MERYIVLETPKGRTERRAFGTVRAFSREAAPPRVSTREVSPREASDLTRDPDVAAYARPMRTKLIAPKATASADAAAQDVWGLEALGVLTSSATGQGVTVAVLDTGIDAAHPAFAGVNILAQDFSGDGDGDVQGHGTHCAGTIFGRFPGQRMGIATGVSRALVGKVLGNDGSGGSDMLFNALQWALQNRAHVISMSLGFDFPGEVKAQVEAGWPADLAASRVLEAYAANLRILDTLMEFAAAQGPFGVTPLIVAASGNESRRQEDANYRIGASIPAAAKDVIAVAAVGRGAGGFKVADFSNNHADVAAPGVDIVSAAPGGGLATMSGTSMACPHVAGVAALWWEVVLAGQGLKTAEQVSARLLGKTRRDVFSDAYDASDLGDGLVTAPQPGDT